MYIISKYKDYYDGVVGTVGMDKTIVYERNTEEIIENKKIPKPFRIKRGWNDRNPFIDVIRMEINRDKKSKYCDAVGFVVGFCGKLYLGWKLSYDVNEWSDEYGEIKSVRKTDIIYGYENVIEFLKNRFWSSNIEDGIRYIRDYNPIHVFREYKTPVFIYDGDTGKPRKESAFIVNPVLKDWEFYKVIDAFQAFQEIQMFLGGVLGTGEKEIIEVEDKYKITQHGFDYKWSFRKEPKNKKI